jgi:GLPGLI family protein
MKTFSIILFFCFSLISLGQKKISTVEYSLIIGDDISMKDPVIDEYYKSAQNGAKSLTYLLTFDATKMKFELKQTMNLDDVNLDFAKAFSGCSGTYYYSKGTPYFYNKPKNNEFTKSIVEYKSFNDWQLTNETKLIGKFLCYKATGFKTVKNIKGLFKNPVTAWYCPKIPVPFGPIGYGNLPGIILELQIKEIVYGATKISLNSGGISKLDFSSKETIISEDELNNRIRTQHEDFIKNKDK